MSSVAVLNDSTALTGSFRAPSGNVIVEIAQDYFDQLKRGFGYAYRAAVRVLDAEAKPDFDEAAGLEKRSAKWHGWAPIGLPGAKFHAMTGQMEKSHDVRRARAAGRAYRAESMGRPAYYDIFAKINNFKM